MTSWKSMQSACRQGSYEQHSSPQCRRAPHALSLRRQLILLRRVVLSIEPQLVQTVCGAVLNRRRGLAARRSLWQSGSGDASVTTAANTTTTTTAAATAAAAGNTTPSTVHPCTPTTTSTTIALTHVTELVLFGHAGVATGCGSADPASTAAATVIATVTVTATTIARVTMTRRLTTIRQRVRDLDLRRSPHLLPQLLQSRTRETARGTCQNAAWQAP